MKRIAAKVVVFLLGGAIVNVAVAWGCALWAEDDLDLAQELSRVETLQLWDEMFPLFDRNKCVQMEANERFATGRYLREINILYNGDSYDDCEKRQARDYRIGSFAGCEEPHAARWEFAGLPCLALRGQILRDSIDPANPKKHSYSGILLSGRNRWHDALFAYVLPVRPIWPGFAINTIFYAAVLW